MCDGNGNNFAVPCGGGARRSTAGVVALYGFDLHDPLAVPASYKWKSYKK